MAKEFIPFITDYHYGLYLNEKDTLYFISDETIEKAIKSIDWDLNDLESAYLKTWVELEQTHRNYCLQKISEEEYEEKVAQSYDDFTDKTGYDFGENCEKLETFLFSYFE